MEDDIRGVYLSNVIENIVIYAENCYELIKQGIQRRHTAKTNMNEDSSRSHSIFTL